MSTTKNKPVDEVRLGTIRAAIWRNDGEKGARYSVTFERLYKEGSEWKTSSSFGRDELLLLAWPTGHTQEFLSWPLKTPVRRA
jgi:hypothetical protein